MTRLSSSVRGFISMTSLVSGASLVCSLSLPVSITVPKSPQMSALCFWPLGSNFHLRGFTDHLELSLFRFCSRSSFLWDWEKVCLRNLQNLWTGELLWIISSIFGDSWSLGGVRESSLGSEVSILFEFESLIFLKMYYSDISWVQPTTKIPSASAEAGIDAGKVASQSQNTQTPFSHTLMGWFGVFNQTNLCVFWHRRHKRLAGLPQQGFASRPFALSGDCCKARRWISRVINLSEAAKAVFQSSGQSSCLEIPSHSKSTLKLQ